MPFFLHPFIYHFTKFSLIFLFLLLAIKLLAQSYEKVLEFDSEKQVLIYRKGFPYLKWKREIPADKLLNIRIAPLGKQQKESNYLLKFIIKDESNFSLLTKTTRWHLLERLRREWVNQIT